MLTPAQGKAQKRELWRDIRREERKKERAELARLRAALRDARRSRAVAMREASAQCRADRQSARERARGDRTRLVAAAREEIAEERAALRERCAQRLHDARAIRDAIESARAKLAAEVANRDELRALERAAQERLRAADPRAGGSDAEVRAALHPALTALFDRVKNQIQASSGMSRTEAFLRYAETHPAEVLATVGHPTAAQVTELERQHAAAVRAFEAKRQARIDRMRAKASRLQAAAEGAQARARTIAEGIPLGQPILVGHHSERRHRRDIARIERGVRRSMQLEKEAQTLARRAQAADRNRAVSSDDPDAVAKLREKLALLERDRARMVDANAAIRSGQPREALAALGFSERLVEQVLTPDPMGHVGFPGYALRNAAAEAARLRRRIDELARRAQVPARAPLEIQGARIEESDNRVRVAFAAKPDAALRSALKHAGFRWAPSADAWQRHASPQAWHEAERILRAAQGAP